MFRKLRFLQLMLLILSVPLALESIYYAINFQSFANQVNPIIINSVNRALYLDGKTFYKVIDGQNKLKIGNSFNLETRVKPESYFITNPDKSIIISRTSDKSLLDYYSLYLEEVISQSIIGLIDKPKFKVKFNIKRYPTDVDGLTLESKTTIPGLDWSNIKIARIQNQIILFINGKLEDLRVLHGPFEYPKDGTNYIGAYHQVNEYFAANRSREFFKGTIDYIKITDANYNIGNWDFNCSLKNSVSTNLDAQLYKGIVQFFDFATGGVSTFTNGRCDKPVVPTPTPTLNIRLLPSPTPARAPTASPIPTLVNSKPYFEEPDFIKNNSDNSYIDPKKSFDFYSKTFKAVDRDVNDYASLNITLESNDSNVGKQLRVLPGRPSQTNCKTGAPTPTINFLSPKNEKTVTLCGFLPRASDFYPTLITVKYEATDGKPDGALSGSYKISVTSR